MDEKGGYERVQEDLFFSLSMFPSCLLYVLSRSGCVRTRTREHLKSVGERGYLQFSLNLFAGCTSGGLFQVLLWNKIYDLFGCNIRERRLCAGQWGPYMLPYSFSRF